MVRLHLIVEGQTERTFAGQLLCPHLVDFGVYVGRIELVAHARKKQRVHRGGLQRYAPFKNDIVRRLKEDQSSDAFLSTMIDLYGLPDDFPESQAAISECDPYCRVKRLENALTEDIGDRRFIPYIQLHEFEALLLAMPDKILAYYDGRENEVAELKKLVEEFGGPEKVNDGESTAPSKRIIAKIPEYQKAKPAAGPQIATEIGLSVIREKCHHFNEWIQRLEQLG
jgi:Domain of unknown function (DUF4276)